MKRELIGCLCVGLCCSSLFAQQLLVSTVRAPGANPAALMASPEETGTSSSQPLPFALRAGATPVEGASLPLVPGMSGPSALDPAALLESPAAVCTQPLSPIVTAHLSDNAFDQIHFTRAAFTGAFRHENIVKMARNFVPGQPLPDAPSYVPLTSRQKFDAFVRNTHTVGFGVGILLDSFISQASGAYPRFGGGMEGYGNRLGAAAAGETSAAFFGGFVFPTLLHQDPRYFPSRQTSITNRLAYAASRVLIGRSDDGRNVINTSVIMSQFVEAAVANAYIPYRNETVSGTLENALSGLGVVAQANILNEFWPDIKEFLSRHNPTSLVHRKATSDSGADQETGR